VIEGKRLRKIGNDDINVVERKLSHSDHCGAVAGKSNAPRRVRPSAPLVLDRAAWLR
jgi:hypothetical protein